MNNEELNKYILHYIEKDKTGRAIMLTGNWGMGKSYYIKNDLIPFLAQKDNGAHPCLVVSLYGLSDLTDISRAIYLEARTRNWGRKVKGFLTRRLKISKRVINAETTRTGALVAKTVIKGVAGKFGVNLTASEKDLEALYSSINLCGKLVILEDVERTQIDLISLMGYVNNLTEQDGVKVLLVTYEDEIIQYKNDNSIKPQADPVANILSEYTKPVDKEYTEKTIEYLEKKEKTISDTIIFEGDLKTAIRQIIESFNNTGLNQFANDESAQDIFEIMFMSSSCNLRSIMFACQKAADIFEFIGEGSLYSNDFVKAVFYGITYFSLRMHSGSAKSWRGSEHLSTELGSSDHPLFKFCFDYIFTQKLSKAAIDSDADAFKRYMLFDRSASSKDKDIRILNSYSISTEAEVKAALESVTVRLMNPDDIPYSDYGLLALLTIGLKYDLGLDTKAAKELLIKNVSGKEENIRDEFIWSLPANYSDEAKEEFNELREKMIASLKGGSIVIPCFDYKPEQIHAIQEYVDNKRGFIFASHGFVSRLDIQKLVNMIKDCSSDQIARVREIFISLYLRTSNIREFLANDLLSIQRLQQEIAKLTTYNGFDKVQQLQCKWFVENLQSIIKRLG